MNAYTDATDQSADLASVTTGTNPEAHYFGVGRIERDQVADYARRKGWEVATAERWLAPILNYEPA